METHSRMSSNSITYNQNLFDKENFHFERQPEDQDQAQPPSFGLPIMQRISDSQLRKMSEIEKETEAELNSYSAEEPPLRNQDVIGFFMQKRE